MNPDAGRTAAADDACRLGMAAGVSAKDTKVVTAVLRHSLRWNQLALRGEQAAY